MSQFCARSVIQEVVSGIQRPEGFQLALKSRFTPNYNGVNSYVEFSEWNPEGEFEIEMDVYFTSRGAGQTHVLLSVPEAVGNANFSVTDGVLNGFSDALNYVDGVLTDLVSEGFHRIKTVVSSFPYPLGYIGKNKYGHRWKGQISNLKLIDKTNPDNSRFYSGVVYSYVDPNTVNVPMPSSTVLVDEWCEVEELATNLTAFDKFPNTISCTDLSFTVGDRASGVYLSDRLTGSVLRVQAKGTTTVEGTFHQITGTLSYSTILEHKFDLDITYKVKDLGTDKFTAYFRFPAAGTMTFEYLKVTKVTHGIMINFGSPETGQPYVPLLGDRDEYCGNYSDPGLTWKRGVRRGITHLTNYNGGSWQDATKIPANSLITAGGELFYLDAAINTRDLVIKNPSGDGKRFQYPNTFKVIKLTDPDYGDYL